MAENGVILWMSWFGNGTKPSYAMAIGSYRLF